MSVPLNTVVGLLQLLVLLGRPFLLLIGCPGPLPGGRKRASLSGGSRSARLSFLDGMSVFLFFDDRPTFRSLST